MHALKAYAAKKTDKRSDNLVEYIRENDKGDEYSTKSVCYYKKCINEEQ